MDWIAECTQILRTIIWQIYRQSLDIVAMAMLLCVLLWGLFGILFQRYHIWRWLNAMTFFCSTSVILYITVLSRSVAEGTIILIPFYSFVEAKNEPEMYRSMLMNVLLFLPIGLSMPYMLLPQMPNKPVLTVMFGLLLSITIEVLQYAFHLGRCEIDDVIMNTLGTLIGSMSYAPYIWIQHAKDKKRSLKEIDKQYF